MHYKKNMTAVILEAETPFLALHRVRTDHAAHGACDRKLSLFLWASPGASGLERICGRDSGGRI